MRAAGIGFGVLAILTIAGYVGAECPAPSAPGVDEIRALLDADSTREARRQARARYDDLAACGPGTAATAEALDLLVESLWRTRFPGDDPLELANRAVALNVELYGEKTPQHATALRNLGRVLDRSDRPRALEVLEQALELRRTLLGDHPDTALVARDVGNAMQNTGNYGRAEELYKTALATQRKYLGDDSIEVARTHQNLTLLYLWIGDLPEARRQAEAATEIAERTYGDDAPALAKYVRLAAGIYRRMGDFVTAGSMYDRSLEIFDRAKMGDSQDMATTLSGTAGFYFEIADLEEAARLYERAEKIFRQHENSDAAAMMSNNLGVVLGRLGDLETAISRHERSLATYERVHGRISTRVARTLGYLADAWSRRGEWDKALEYAAESMSIREQIFGPEHPSLAGPLLVVARIERDRGRFDEARALIARAVTLTANGVGGDHPLIGDALAERAVLELRAGRISAAAGAAERAFDVANGHLRETAGVLPERQALSYGALSTSRLALVLSTSDRDDRDSIENVWDRVIRSRGVVLDAIGLRNRRANVATSPAAQRILRDHRNAASAYAALWIRGVGDQTAAAYDEVLRSMRGKKEKFETELARVLTAPIARSDDAGYAEVAAAIGDGDALVAFVEYERSAAGSADSVPSFAALILDPDRRTHFIDLGPGSPIDERVESWWRAAARPFAANDDAAAEAEAESRRMGRALRMAVWDPVSKYLADARRVFIVPDGTLNIVNFAALPVGDDRYLADEGPILHYVATERDLVNEPRPPTGSGLLALGGPDYSSVPASVTEDGVVTRKLATTCAGFRSARWQPLPETLQEAFDVKELWGADDAVVLTGSRATEGALRRLAPGKRVLHLATHGYFLDGSCATTSRLARGIGGLLPTSADFVEAPVAGDNPLLLSGLVLAGANARERATNGLHDGILTSEELASLDLSGVEWAVLSACDTGRGEIRSGEGVFGLRRALHLAGARTVIMSLWPVGDEATRPWMGRLYRNRLTERMTSAEAMQATYRQTLEALRSDGKSTHPFFWASFIAAGDWR